MAGVTAQDKAIAEAAKELRVLQLLRHDVPTWKPLAVAERRLAAAVDARDAREITAP
jgi:hypothetical protein